ncbi:MAG: hypothetical protein ACK2UK_21270 [Candidatus Promineifilaceae bacterium]
MWINQGGAQGGQTGVFLDSGEQLGGGPRDEILGTSLAGQHYTGPYFAHGGEMQSLLFCDQLLLIEALNTLEIWEPNLNALVRGQGAEFTITAGQVNAIDDFLVNLSAAASPEPQQVIADERSKLPLPESFVGLTMEEAREIVVDYAT